MGKFGEKLAELRQDHKMTQRALAQRLHVTSGTISNYENGNHLPDVDKLVDLAIFSAFLPITFLTAAIVNSLFRIGMRLCWIT